MSANPAADLTPALAMRDVTKSYVDGERTVVALENASLDVFAGEMVAIMGTSGSGKSTLLAIAGALLAPTAGDVWICGQPLNGLSSGRELARLRRERIGFVFQDFNLLPSLTALENVALPLDLGGAASATARSEARRALAVVGMRERSGSFPDELSGGQRQRVAIARAIVGERRLLLADEPTGALDSVTGESVLKGLRQRADEGAAVVVVTHDPRHAAWADRIVYLSDGRILDETRALDADSLLAGGPQ